MPKLSVTIITRNEASNIGPALASAAWADELVVVDCGSTDETVSVARQHGARVVHRDWSGYVDQKNFAAARAAHEWILSLDADERVTPALAAEIRQLLTTDPPLAGYRVPRVSWYLGTWVRTTDWYPDLQLRLYHRARGRWTPRRVHESVTLDSQPGQLRGELEHRPYRDISHHLQTMNHYTSLAAAEMHEQGRRSGVVALVGHPLAAFLRNYIARGGFRHGAVGLVISALNAHYVFLKFLKLWELRREASGFRVQDSAGPRPGGVAPPARDKVPEP